MNSSYRRDILRNKSLKRLQLSIECLYSLASHIAVINNVLLFDTLVRDKNEIASLGNDLFEVTAKVGDHLAHNGVNNVFRKCRHINH